MWHVSSVSHLIMIGTLTDIPVLANRKAKAEESDLLLAKCHQERPLVAREFVRRLLSKPNKARETNRAMPKADIPARAKAKEKAVTQDLAPAEWTQHSIVPTSQSALVLFTVGG